MPVPIFPISDKTIARFHRHVKRGGANACWVWKKGRGKKGYGSFRLSKPRRVVRSHRVAFALANKEDPGEFYVCHSCDNPPCCNPKHLFKGTVQDNADDMKRKGRGVSPDSSGENNGRALLTAHDVEQVKRLIAQGCTNVIIGFWFGVTHSMISRIRRGLAWGVKEPMTEKYQSIKGARK